MQPQNVDEYKAIREELARLRNCMTSYVGFVVLGSAPAFGFLADKATDYKQHLAMAIVAILLSIIAVLILFLLSYKFTSHNRYAGYSKLLAHERFEGPESPKDIFLWEICLDKLRAWECEAGRANEFDYWKGIKQWHIVQKPVDDAYKDQRDRVENWYQRRGWGLLAFGGRDTSGSWRLPLYESRIFGAISLAFVVFAAYFLKSAINPPFFSNAVGSLGFWIVIALCALLITLWAKFVSKLDRQMRGNETVEAFCCKFLPIRVQLLHELNFEKYSLIGLSAQPRTSPDDKAKGAGAGNSAEE
jgi:hypothetical protein